MKQHVKHKIKPWNSSSSDFLVSRFPLFCRNQQFEENFTISSTTSTKSRRGRHSVDKLLSKRINFWHHQYSINRASRSCTYGYEVTSRLHFQGHRLLNIGSIKCPVFINIVILSFFKSSPTQSFHCPLIARSNVRVTYTSKSHFANNSSSS